ncbi:hypothetical protein KN815_15020 [Streptomyces sp. 4503]|uniref:Integral membrane protein n=1 Tax=Streptomyces niphimycinicus TaxID=2842201 RepID=A0ABS6CES8_9ACTN|nr:hypothetical protein [Streptomyces niphimycinicus]MBU3865336.1 hypothetical protein [Streptomyces niphimycinicus]
MSPVLHNAALITAAGTAWYAVAITAVTAVAARNADRRRDAREVPKVLVRRNAR